MTSKANSMTRMPINLISTRWLRIGLQAAAGSIIAVLLTQAIILSLWPDLAAFKPLDNYARSALFTFVPAVGATAVFARLAKTQDRPVAKFMWIAAGVLLLSFIPDFILPVPYRTLPASTAAAFMHLIAGIVTVTLILVGYNRSASVKDTK